MKSDFYLLLLSSSDSKSLTIPGNKLNLHEYLEFLATQAGKQQRVHGRFTNVPSSKISSSYPETKDSCS